MITVLMKHGLPASDPFDLNTCRIVDAKKGNKKEPVSGSFENGQSP